MNRAILMILPLVLAGCLEDEKALATPTMCYDIIPINDGPPRSPLLVNKCTSETWMLLRTVFPKGPGETTPGYKYGWHRIEVWSSENSVAGK